MGSHAGDLSVEPQLLASRWVRVACVGADGLGGACACRYSLSRVSFKRACRYSLSRVSCRNSQHVLACILVNHPWQHLSHTHGVIDSYLPTHHGRLIPPTTSFSHSTYPLYSPARPFSLHLLTSTYTRPPLTGTQAEMVSGRRSIRGGDVHRCCGARA
jgi:hypothetical protein